MLDPCVQAQTGDGAFSRSNETVTARIDPRGPHRPSACAHPAGGVGFGAVWALWALQMQQKCNTHIDVVLRYHHYHRSELQWSGPWSQGGGTDTGSGAAGEARPRVEGHRSDPTVKSLAARALARPAPHMGQDRMVRRRDELGSVGLKGKGIDR
jgi:hypothetical protein